MPKHVCRNPLCPKRRALLLSCPPVAGHKASDGITAQGRTARPGEQRRLGLVWDLAQPLIDDIDCGPGERSAPGLPVFTSTGYVRTAPELNVASAQAGDLRDAQTGLEGQDQDRVVPAADPG